MLRDKTGTAGRGTSRVPPSGLSPFLHWQYPGSNVDTDTFMYAWGVGGSLVNPVDESISQILIEQDCTLDQLTVASQANVAGGNTAVAVVRVNGVDTALTATITAGNNSAQDNVNSVAVVRGDLVSLSWELAGGTPGNLTAWGTVRMR